MPRGSAPFYLPDDLGLYRTCLIQLARQLVPYKVRGFSIGNEQPNAWHGTGDDSTANKTADYLRLIKTSYEALHTGNPDCFVLDYGAAGTTYASTVTDWLWQQGRRDEALWFIQTALYPNCPNPPGRDHIPQTLDELAVALDSTFVKDLKAWQLALFTDFAPYHDRRQLHYYQGPETLPLVFDFLAAMGKEYGSEKEIEWWECGKAWDRSEPFDREAHAVAVKEQVRIAIARGVKFINYFPIIEMDTRFKGLVNVGPPQTLLPAGVAWGQLASQWR